MITDDHILFRDEDLIAINKPSNLLVHRSDIDRHETVNLIQLARELTGQIVYPAHRLDKPTSGIILLAFSKKALSNLREQFESLTVAKKYHAIVRGHLAQPMTIEHALKEKPVFKTQDQSKLKVFDATTELAPIQRYVFDVPVDRYPQARYSLIELTPLTGRRHQLRRHLKHISHPIIGDTSYGKTSHNQFFRTHFHCSRLLLHATSITFTHPSLNSELTLQAPYPDSFDTLLEQMHKESM